MKRDDIVYNSQETAERIKLRAKICGTTMKSMLSNLELGINIVSQLAKGQEMSYLNLAKIADYLNCSVDYLLGRTDNPEVAHSQQYHNKNGVQVVSSHWNCQEKCSQRTPKILDRQESGSVMRELL